MSSELQLDVCHLNQWRRHLVNAYEVKAGVVFVAGKTVWSMPERFKVVCIPYKALLQVLCFTFFTYYVFVGTLNFTQLHCRVLLCCCVAKPQLTSSVLCHPYHWQLCRCRTYSLLKLWWMRRRQRHAAVRADWVLMILIRLHHCSISPTTVSTALSAGRGTDPTLPTSQ